MRANTLVATCAALAVSAVGTADVIVDQPAWEPGYLASQVFAPPYVDFSCSAFDDFTILTDYNMTALTVYGFDNVEGGSAANTAVTVRFYATPNLNGSAIATRTGTQVGSNLVFDLTGLTLGAGTYWISAQVTRSFDAGGQWFWHESTTANGAEAMWHNPGGAFGYGTNPISISSMGQDQHDMAFTLEGYVPAPGAIALLGAAGALGRRRRRSS